jgi:adenylate kinase
MTPVTVFFSGKPGSGKGTQARMLAARTGWQVLASGAQFRAIAAEDTAIGRKIRDEIEAGQLAPYWFAMYLYQRALFSVSDDANVIFDGFNRKAEEAQLIIDSLAWLGRPFIVLNIGISDDEVRERLAGRSMTSGRVDDRQNAIEERLEEFETHTVKALQVFRDMGVLVEIDGEQSPEAVASDVAKALNLS